MRATRKFHVVTLAALWMSRFCTIYRLRLCERSSLHCFGEFVERLTGSGLGYPRIECRRIGNRPDRFFDSFGHPFEPSPKECQNRFGLAFGLASGFGRNANPFIQKRIQFFRKNITFFLCISNSSIISMFASMTT